MNMEEDDQCTEADLLRITYRQLQAKAKSEKLPSNVKDPSQPPPKHQRTLSTVQRMRQPLPVYECYQSISILRSEGQYSNIRGFVQRPQIYTESVIHSSNKNVSANVRQSVMKMKTCDSLKPTTTFQVKSSNTSHQVRKMAVPKYKTAEVTVQDIINCNIEKSQTFSNPNISGYVDLTEENESSPILDVTENSELCHDYYHKKIRPDQVRCNTINEDKIEAPVQQVLPQIDCVFPQLKNSRPKDLTEHVNVDENNVPAPSYLSSITSTLETTLNFKRSFLVNTPFPELERLWKRAVTEVTYSFKPISSTMVTPSRIIANASAEQKLVGFNQEAPLSEQAKTLDPNQQKYEIQGSQLDPLGQSQVLEVPPSQVAVEEILIQHEKVNFEHVIEALTSQQVHYIENIVAGYSNNCYVPGQIQYHSGPIDSPQIKYPTEVGYLQFDDKMAVNGSQYVVQLDSKKISGYQNASNYSIDQSVYAAPDCSQYRHSEAKLRSSPDDAFQYIADDSLLRYMEFSPDLEILLTTASTKTVPAATVTELVEDALEFIAKDGNYLERIEADVRMQCILCSWAGPKIILEQHIRKEHSDQIIKVDGNECNITYRLGQVVNQETWLSTVIQCEAKLYALSVKYEDPEQFMANLSLLTTTREPQTGSITCYNNVTGEPYTWRGNIPQIYFNMPYETDFNCLTLKLSNLNLIPNRETDKLYNRALVNQSPSKVVLGSPELNDIQITMFVKLS